MPTIKQLDMRQVISSYLNGDFNKQTKQTNDVRILSIKNNDIFNVDGLGDLCLSDVNSKNIDDYVAFEIINK